MTVTPPASARRSAHAPRACRRGVRCRRDRAAARSRRRARRNVAGDASTSTPTPTPTPTPDIPAGTTQFTLSPVGSGIVQPGDPLAVSVTLQNGTAAP